MHPTTVQVITDVGSVVVCGQNKWSKLKRCLIGRLSPSHFPRNLQMLERSESHELRLITHAVKIGYAGRWKVDSTDLWEAKVNWNTAD